LYRGRRSEREKGRRREGEKARGREPVLSKGESIYMIHYKINMEEESSPVEDFLELP